MCLYDAEFYKLISRYHQKLIGNDFGQSYYSNYKIYYTYTFFLFHGKVWSDSDIPSRQPCAAHTLT